MNDVQQFNYSKCNKWEISIHVTLNEYFITSTQNILIGLWLEKTYIYQLMSSPDEGDPIGNLIKET